LLILICVSLGYPFLGPLMGLGQDADTAEIRKRYEQAALVGAGDAQKGKALFFGDARIKCSQCHQVDDQGTPVGPSLTTIGGKLDRSHLIESLLQPSRQIVEGYRTSVFLTRDGNTLSGIVKSRSDGLVRALDANGKMFELPAASLDSEKISGVSIMPAGLAAQLSTDEFTNLVAYLESLVGGGQKFGEGIRGPIQLPSGFSVQTVATGLTGAVGMETTSDGRVFICEQTGALRVVRGDVLLERPMVILPVQMEWERGLIGVTIAPDFVQSPWVYVCYVARDPYPHHVVSRWQVDGDEARPGSQQILLEGDDQRTLGGNAPSGHQGGGMHFGKDGCLYVGIGEQTAGKPAQELNSLLGKMLRIHADGRIPSDNPFLHQTQGKYRAIWALGLRNPFTFAFDSESGDLLIHDAGGNYEEINRGKAGANYGWPVIEHGPTDDPRYVGPIHIYPQASIGGGVFVPIHSHWPKEYRGKYLFADFVHGWIRMIDPKVEGMLQADQATTLAQGLRRPVDLRWGADGSLYVLLRNTWVVDQKFVPGTSSLLKIRYEDPGHDGLSKPVDARPWIQVAQDRQGFVMSASGAPFVPWGVNYDHDAQGRLIEDYWEDEWSRIEGDFEEIRGLNANAVRIHLQLARFMESESQPNRASLRQLERLVQLAESKGLYLNLTGLGCYHKQDVPGWYNALDEGRRWEAQARFWEAVAATCAKSPAVFCYDLMNEPVVPGGRRMAGDWLGPAFAGKHFVQFVTLDQAQRPRPAIAKAWIEHLVSAIRRVDGRHLITVGLVDWSLDRPGLTSGFPPEQVCDKLDFVSVHLYPESGRVPQAMQTLQGFQVGKPIVIEETFPLKCSIADMEQFLAQSRGVAGGWFSFYWGTPPSELKDSTTLGQQILLQWLESFRRMGPELQR
jgi:putative heme-binding domain-containing protein